jgi:nucleoside-diphosphate-sugar epimerase
VKILITGGTGFIANELLTRLQKNGYDVYNLERYAAGRYSQKKNFLRYLEILEMQHQ